MNIIYSKELELVESESSGHYKLEGLEELSPRFQEIVDKICVEIKGIYPSMRVSHYKIYNYLMGVYMAVIHDSPFDFKLLSDEKNEKRRKIIDELGKSGRNKIIEWVFKHGKIVNKEQL